MKGYQVVARFDDDLTGKVVERPGMKAMLAHLAGTDPDIFKLATLKFFKKSWRLRFLISQRSLHLEHIRF